MNIINENLKKRAVSFFRPIEETDAKRAVKIYEECSYEEAAMVMIPQTSYVPCISY